MASIEVSEAQGVRYLHFGSDLVQGAMRLARPWALELEYTREMMLPLALRTGSGWPRSVLQVGLGSASVTRFLHRYRPDTRVTVVEIDAAVVAAARQFFKLPDESPRLRIEIADACDYLAGTSARFDLLLVDGCDPQGYAGMLETLPFFLNCRDRLKTGGMMAVNLLTWRGNVAAVAKRICTAFDDCVLVLPPCGAGNTIAIASNGRDMNRAPDDLRAGVARLKTETGLDLGPTLKRLG